MTTLTDIEKTNVIFSHGLTRIDADQKKKRESKSAFICANLRLKKNNRMKGKAHGQFVRLRPNPDLYPDELVNARSRPGTSKKHLHLAPHRLA